MRYNLVLFLLLLLVGSQSKAQEGIPVYFDYLSDNYYLVFPSMAGITQGGKIRATARKQWFDVEDAPSLQTINGHFRLGDSPSGIGAIIFNDANGYHSQTGLKLTYAHHLRMGGSDMRVLNQLSFGLSATILQSSLDETEFRSAQPDPAVAGIKLSASYSNVDIGISYNFQEFYTHFAVTNALTGSKRNVYYRDRQDNPDQLVIDNIRRYLISTGYVFGKNEWQVEPSILFQLTEFTKEKNIDINAKVYRDVDFGRIWGGLSYRRSFDGAQFQDSGSFGEQRLQLVTPIVGANIKNFMVSYNYSYQMGSIRFDNGGFHQITLGYDFGQTERKYDCYCPAAN
ncbi:type IX secretion system membrane protein PorP/SprF [Maribacter confluentis]|uniref:Type IX secretion system membrane protein, PorP/SprF family n=2 Tax=Maribacter TaxID=252356 RepID=A0ABY1SEJ1_9FLAO|nr:MULTISPECIES: type IX secretion system membrane protein PorP/SprF [Maribacter]MDO1513511.1 type IX secretion system membrane protein PorP/SprF [Maribacter confluentis]TVZ16758.1 type IX secretion system PorP/SprF family membrane protein [Maribacter sp. MAR_2009_72]SNR29008.1 type IX secretion system membrane protein, PorP/SprF family [Maribacter sedimenticola]